jgi:hypothetical protein
MLKEVVPVASELEPPMVRPVGTIHMGDFMVGYHNSSSRGDILVSSQLSKAKIHFVRKDFLNRAVSYDYRVGGGEGKGLVFFSWMYNNSTGLQYNGHVCPSGVQCLCPTTSRVVNVVVIVVR